MKFNLIETKEILDLDKEMSEKYGFELQVNEFPKTELRKPYSVTFSNSKVMESGHVIDCYGFGHTIDEAIKDYCSKIETKKIAVHPSSDYRKEFMLPKLIHTKILNK